MSVLLLALFSVSWPLPTPHADPVAASCSVARLGDEKAIKALSAWLKLYRSGKIDIRSKDDLGKDSIAARFGLTGKNALGHPTWAGDLETILAAVVALDTPDAAEALLEVAAIGFEGKSPLSLAPLEVRTLGDKYIEKLAAGPARDTLAKAARGELKVEKARALATRLAAIRGLGLLKDPAQRGALELLLGDADENVRAEAAASLAKLGDEAAVTALVAVLERPTETGDHMLATTAEALVALLRGPATAKAPEATPAPGAAGSPAPGPAADQPAAPAASKPLSDVAKRAATAAAGALGRSTWRADLALVNLLDEFRVPEAIPGLITVLERFAAHPELVKSGVLSGLLLFRAHEALVSITGAVHPADQPARWRSFWDAEKDKLAVHEKREKPAAGGTVAAFCGIPMQGTRVVFVLDLSGSMTWPMEEQTTDKNRRRAIRLDFAKRELNQAIDGLSPGATFNLVTFNGNPKPELWSKDLVPATEKNRERFKKYVEGLRADGGTNLWSGLDEALKIKSQVQGHRYGANIDELFVLSDGAPTVGDILDPVEIARLVQETNRTARVRINTVFISSEAPPEIQRMEAQMSMTPQKLMQTIAEQNGGAFREL